MSGKTAVFSVSGLKTSQKYIATVSGIKDIAGNEMASDSLHSFTTRSDPNAKFAVIDNNTGQSSYTAYCGFENENSTVELIATLSGVEQTEVTYNCPASTPVTVDSSGILTVDTKNYNPATDDDVKTITVTATSNLTGDTAQFIVTIEPWYPVKTADDFGTDGNISKNLSGRFRLMTDIVFSGDGSYNLYPAGSYTNVDDNKPFTGIFDGNGKTLSNFSLKAGTNNDENYAGLFAYNTGTIKNLIVDKAKFEGPTVSYVGIICGYNQGVISGCEVKGINIKANDNVGGLIGHMRDGTIEDCSSAGSVKGNDNVGGLIGRVNNNLQINFNSKKIYANCEVEGRNYVGGFIGNVTSDSEITIKGKLNNDIYSAGSVKGSQHVGGFIGAVYKSAELEYCSSSSTVSKNENFSDPKNVGGLIGYFNKGTVNNCYSTGSVTAASAECVGGLIGIIDTATDASRIIANCYHTTGEVSGKKNVGGLIGQNIGFDSKRNVIKDCYSSGDVRGGTNVGGLIGDSSYSDIKVESGKTYSSCNVFGNTSSGTAAGGLIGYCNGTNIAGNSGNKIYTEGTVEGHTNVGGLIGQIYGSAEIKYCYHEYGVVQGNTKVGGLIGYISTGPGSEVKISGSYAKFNLDNNSDVKAFSKVGGLIGFIIDSTSGDIGVYVSQCYACVDIINEETDTEDAKYEDMGGLIGYCDYASAPGKDIITECFSAGNIVAHDNVGGLIGIMTNCRISDCYSTSNVDSFSVGGNGGGLVGKMISGSKISNCYAAGDVKCVSGGGLVGVNDSNMPDPIISSFWKKDKIGGGTNPDNGFGTPKLSSEMKTVMPYLDGSWDISFVNGTATIWNIDSGINGGYPYLKNNPPPPQ